jgi:integrase
LRSGRIVIASPLSLADFFEHTYCPRRLPGGSLNTLRLYACTFRAFERHLQRPPLVQDLEADTIAGFLSAYSTGHEPRSVNSHLDRLLALARYACQRRLIAEVPDLLHWPEPQRTPRAYTSDQVSRLLWACRQSRGCILGLPAGLYWEAVALTFYYTGIRASACWLLEQRDLEGPLLTIRPETHKPRTELRFLLPADCMEAIHRIWSPPRKFLFPWDRAPGERYPAWRRILADAKLPMGHLDLFQRLRRTSGTLVEAAGGDGSKHLGNSRAVFERHYLDPSIANRSQVGLLPRPQIQSPTDRQLWLF